METIFSKPKNIDYYKSSNDYLKSKNLGEISYLRIWNPSKEESDDMLYFNEPETEISDVVRIIGEKKSKINLGSFSKFIIDFDDIPDKIIKVEDKNYFVPKELNEIVEEIELSKEISEYKDNWDGENALAVSKEIYNESIVFLLDYSKFIFKTSGIAIDAPEINPGRNGNVYLSWRTNKARLAISIEHDKYGVLVASYYGDLKNNKEPIKGNVRLGKVAEYLAYWMKNLV